MALCLSDFKGYFQMVNLKMENVAYEYEDFGIQEDKKHWPIPSACQD